MIAITVIIPITLTLHLHFYHEVAIMKNKKSKSTVLPSIMDFLFTFNIGLCDGTAVDPGQVGLMGFHNILWDQVNVRMWEHFK